MGWCSGTDVAQPIIDYALSTIGDPNIRKGLYSVLYEALTDEDWDCIDEVDTADECWYAMLCEKGIHSPMTYENASFICRGCAGMFDH